MPPISPTLRTCGSHAGRRAGWTCDACSAALCPECVERVTHASATLERCRSCGGNARRLTVHRSSVPYARRVVGAWRYPLAPTGLVATAIFAALHLAGDLVPPLSFVDLALFAYAFYLVRESALGHDDIAPPDFTSVSGDLLLPTLRAIVASAWVALPLIAWLAWKGPSAGFDPLVPVFLAAGFLYLPSAFLIAATGTGILDLLNPITGVAYALRLGRDYWVCVAALAAVAIGAAGVSLLASLLPVVGLGVHAFAWVYFPFVGARVLGLLLYTRGDSLGYGVPSDYEMPVLEAEAAPAPEPLPREAPLDPGGPALDALSAALAARDAAGAVTSFEALPGARVEAVPAESLIAVAQAATTLGRFEVARAALEAAARPGSPDEAKAWVLLARLHGEKLDDPKRANEIYGFVCRRFPGSAAAQFAERRLTAVEPSTP